MSEMMSVAELICRARLSLLQRAQHPPWDLAGIARMETRVVEPSTYLAEALLPVGDPGVTYSRHVVLLMSQRVGESTVPLATMHIEDMANDIEADVVPEDGLALMPPELFSVAVVDLRGPQVGVELCKPSIAIVLPPSIVVDWHDYPNTERRRF